MSELLNAIKEIGDSFDLHKKANEKTLSSLNSRLQDIESGRGTFTKRLESLQDRLEEREALADRPGKPGASNQYSREQNEYKGVFLDWIRQPNEGVYKRRLDEAKHELSKKTVTIGSNPAGGYALPLEISSQIEDRVRQLNPFRRLVRVDKTSSNDYRALVSMGDGAAGWVGESGSRSATNTPTLRERKPTMGEQYAYPQASNWSLKDIFFDVQGWLVNEVSMEFASQEATAIVSGDGSDKPTGFLASSPTSPEDYGSPMRVSNVIQYVPISVPASSPFATTIPIDSLIDLVGKVRERYLMESDRVAFVMHRLTATHFRKQKGTDGQYLWQESSQLGQPAMLLGYPVYTCDAMPTIAPGAFPVLFGNFARGYLLADRVEIEIIVNPYSAPGFTSFYVSRRLGGCVLNNDAVKALKIGLS